MNTQFKNYELVVKEHHLDTFGHVNNSVYLQLFEEARWQLITEGGYGLAEVQKNQKGPVVLEINIKFLKELKLREKIKINFETIKYDGKIGQVKQQMINEKNEVACEAIFTVGFFDLVLRRLINPTEEWKKAIGVPS
jgi:YbgC/YbaW family acyl-CoA thioester hydrolase